MQENVQRAHYQMHMEGVDAVRKYHFWRYKFMLYAVLVLFAVSWLHYLVEYALRINIKHQVLLDQGEPLGCMRSKSNNNGWGYDYFIRERDIRECEVYILGLAETEHWWLFPDLLEVTVDTLVGTVVRPMKGILDWFYRLPYMVQTGIYAIITTLAGLWVATRNFELRWLWNTKNANNNNNNKNKKATKKKPHPRPVVEDPLDRYDQVMVELV
jgi:hypothetical protein